MRIRATVVAVSGGLVLSAVAVPAAHADDAAKPYALDVSFSNVRINNGKSIVAGTTGTLTVPITYTLTHGADVDIAAEDFFTDVELYYVASQDVPQGDADYTLFGDDWAHCTATSATVAKCTQSIVIHPALDLFNATAGKWKAYAYARALNGQDMGSDDYDVTKVGVVEKESLPGPNLLRQSKLSVNATPEPVKKGKTITVTGKLTRANWDGGNYTGYAGQPVKLQFRKNGTSTYTTLKTVKTTTKGDLKTTVKANVDGYFRYVFAGTATTAALGAVPDFVDVK
ncbi:hypothetical protein [Streptomyces geranii]|uniref:hypothetical protein n=1 Tax=Streptomyces geranii TaxID=2058923 RepID=UPI000D03DE61|nr:hypothetical protein [Streptomyces geranii]